MREPFEPREEPQSGAVYERRIPPPRRSPSALAALVAMALGLWLWVSLPLGLGDRTLYFRDVFSVHLPLKAFGTAELCRGRIPAFNPTWGLGQPFRGNPNALPFYPGNLLYCVLPFWSAFNLHYALHWLLAGLAMAALARGLGQDQGAALLAGMTYAGSGWILSGLSFYNLLAVAAWWPFVLLGAARGGRRGTVLAGVACGLALLGGEPVTATLGIVPLALVAVQSRGLRRGLRAVVGIGSIGLLIALPQVVATARILRFTSRGIQDFGGAGRFHLGIERLLEAIIPFPFGHPWTFDESGYWPWGDQPGPPFVLTLHVGIVALWLAVLGARRARSWTLLALAGLALAWAGGLGGDALVLASQGLARYPEKFLFWTALALPLLAGRGLQRAAEAPQVWRWAAAGAGLTVLLAAGLFAAGPRVAAWLAAGRVDPHFLARAPQVRVTSWISALILAAALLALAAVAVRRGSVAGLAAAQLLALLPMAGLVMTAPVEDFGPSPWLTLAGKGAQVVAGPPPDSLADPSYRSLVGILAHDLAPAPGVLHGMSYPLAKDIDGFYSPFLALVQLRFAGLSHRARTNWLRTLGVRAAVFPETAGTPSLRLAGIRERCGGTSRLFFVGDPAPTAWWPGAVISAASPAAAFSHVSFAQDPVSEVAVAGEVEHHRGASLTRLREQPDRIEIDVSGPGGFLVLRRAYQPLYEAAAAGTPLEILPANLALLAVKVPPGSHRLRVEVRAWPEAVAGGIGLVTLLAAVALGWRRGER